MDAFAEDNRLWPPPLTFTYLKLFFVVYIVDQGLKRILTARNSSELDIVIVLTANSIYLYLYQQKNEFWPAQNI